MGRKSNHLIERVYAHLSKNGCRKSGFLADPDLTGTVFNLLPPKDELCQVWLKFAQWFWRRSQKCKSLQTDGQTDRQTTGDQNSSLELSAFKDLSSIVRSYVTIHFDKLIKGNLYIKLTEQHDHNM
jgi:hypothetical protein